MEKEINTTFCQTYQNRQFTDKKCRANRMKTSRQIEINSCFATNWLVSLYFRSRKKANEDMKNDN